MTLNGPDGWAASLMDMVPVRLRHLQGGAGVMMWAGCGWLMVGPFLNGRWVKKMNSKNYCLFLEDTIFKQWLKKKVCSIQINHDINAGQYSIITCRQVLQWLASKQRLQRWPNDNLAPVFTWFKSNWKPQAWGLQSGKEIYITEQHLEFVLAPSAKNVFFILKCIINTYF